MGLDYSLISIKIKQLERANQMPATKDVAGPEPKIGKLPKAAQKNTPSSPFRSLGVKRI